MLASIHNVPLDTTSKAFCYSSLVRCRSRRVGRLHALHRSQHAMKCVSVTKYSAGIGLYGNLGDLVFILFAVSFLDT